MNECCSESFAGACGSAFDMPRSKVGILADKGAQHVPRKPSLMLNETASIFKLQQWNAAKDIDDALLTKEPGVTTAEWRVRSAHKQTHTHTQTCRTSRGIISYRCLRFLCNRASLVCMSFRILNSSRTCLPRWSSRNLDVRINAAFMTNPGPLGECRKVHTKLAHDQAVTRAYARSDDGHAQVEMYVNK